MRSPIALEKRTVVLSRASLALFTLTFALTALSGCASAPPAAQAKSKPIARPAPPAACHAPSAIARPFFADAPAEERTRLDAAMTKGLAVVAYDCHGLHVLEGCSAFGDYAFAGTTPADAIVHLSLPDEVQANLPATGAALGASLALDLGQGVTLDVAQRRIGFLRTTRARVDRADLAGACEGATHVVVGVGLGASAMQIGSGARAPVDLLAAASASGGDGAATPLGQGSIDACRAATLDARGPPGGCGAVLDLDLRALDAPSDARASGNDRELIQDRCPSGMALSEGKCVVASSEVHVCAAAGAECAAQCDKSNAAACNAAGIAACPDTACSDEAFKLATRLYRKACDAGEPTACRNLAQHLGSRGADVGKGSEPSVGQLLAQACDGGDATACLEVSAIGAAQPAGPIGAERACRLGSTPACSRAAWEALQRGDRLLEAQVGRRACAGGNLRACYEAGEHSARGDATVRDPDLAKALWTQGCGRDSLAPDADSLRSCVRLAGALTAEAKGAMVPDAARDLYTRVCDHANGQWAGDSIAEACWSMATLLFSGDARHPPDTAAGVVRLRRACDTGTGPGAAACFDVAVREARGEGTSIDLDASARHFGRACALGRYCRDRGRRFLPSGATPEPALAAVVFRASCDQDDPDGCRDLARLLRGVPALARKSEAQDAGQKALRIFESRCDSAWFACLQAADMLRDGDGVPANGARAAKLEAPAIERAEQGCQHGAQGSCEELAKRALHGKGVRRDPKRAIDLLESACARTASACNSLGETHRWADGVPRSYPKAAAAYRRACAGGSTIGCTNLGELFAEGKASPEGSDKSARMIFEEGCLASKQRLACVRLGSMLANGDGVPKDETRAAAMFARVATADVVDGILAGCDGGAGDDCSAAGFMLFRGLGVPKDEKRAVALMKRGCKGGDDWGCARVKEIAPRR